MSEPSLTDRLNAFEIAYSVLVGTLVESGALDLTRLRENFQDAAQQLEQRLPPGTIAALDRLGDGLAVHSSRE